MKTLFSILIIYFVLLIFLVIIMQSSILINLFGLIPFIIISYVSIRWKEWAGLGFGLVLGITILSLEGNPFSQKIIIYPITGWLIAFLSTQFDFSISGIQTTIIILIPVILRLIFNLIFGFELQVTNFWIIPELIIAILIAQIGFPLIDYSLSVHAEQ